MINTVHGHRVATRPASQGMQGRLREAARQVREEAPPHVTPEPHHTQGHGAAMADGSARRRSDAGYARRRQTRPATRSACWRAVAALLRRRCSRPAQATRKSNPSRPSTSTTQAGGHPDLTTSFTLETRAPRGRPERDLQRPRGRLRQPQRDHPLHLRRTSPSTSARPNSQAGLITVYANYEGNSDYLLGTAPIFDLDPSGDQTALFAFIVPTLNIPIDIPVAVRTDGDYGLRFTVQDITQLTPLAGANLTFWGFPAECRATTPNASPKASRANRPNCPGLAGHELPGQARPVEHPGAPADRQPDHLHRQAADHTLEVQTYQDPEHLSRTESSYPATTGCEHEIFNPVLYASPTTNETDSPSGLNIELSAPQFLGFAASPSELKKRPSPCRQASRSTPMPPTARRLHRSPGELRLRGPGAMSRQLQDRHLLDRHPGPQRAASKGPSTSANRSPATSTASS